MLDTNREHLVWPGVPAGGRGVQPLFIKNGSETETMQLTLAIQDCPHFKVGLCEGEICFSYLCFV